MIDVSNRELGVVLLLALLPGLGNFLGGLLAEWRPSSKRLLNWALHAAAGIVMAIVSIELLPEALGRMPGGMIALAFLAGGLAYLAIELLLDRFTRGSGTGRMWMIIVAVAVDLTSDGLMIGTGSAVSISLGLALAGGQILADVPEGYAAVANMRDKGIPRLRRLLVSLSFFVWALAAAAGAYFLLRGADDFWKRFALVFVSGLLIVAAVEDLLEEAHDAHEDSHLSVLALVGGFCLFTLVSSGLESLAE